MALAIRTLLSRTFRFLVVAALLIWIAGKVHWHDYETTGSAGLVATHPGLASSLSGIHAAWLIGALMASVLSLLVVALRWRGLLRVLDVNIDVRESFRLGFLAEFFNTIIPGLIGGDAAKAYFVIRRTQRPAGVIASLLVDRALGLVGMVLFALVSLLALGASGFRVSGALWLPVLLASATIAGVVVAALLLFHSRLQRALRLDRLGARLPFVAPMAAVREAFTHYRHGNGLATASVLTVLAQILGMVSVALVGLGLHLAVPWYAYLFYVPLVTIVAALPITPGGLGVMEGLYLLCFATAGNSSAAAALVVLLRGVQLLGVLPGALLLALSSDRPPVGAIRKALASRKPLAEPGESHAAMPFQEKAPFARPIEDVGQFSQRGWTGKLLAKSRRKRRK